MSGGIVLKKIKWNQRKVKILICGGGVVALGILAVLVACLSGGGGSRLENKIKEYSKNYGITVSEIKNDKALMEQFTMETIQEEKIDKLTKNITVTDEEIKNYREMLGSTLDEKKSIFILFNTYDECKAYIDKYGEKADVKKIQNGTLPMMEKDEDGEYFNVIGNEVLETVFDSLKDGEYTKEPFEFSGMYCYLKRLNIKSSVSTDDEIKDLIKSEKANEQLQNEAKKGR